MDLKARKLKKGIQILLKSIKKFNFLKVRISFSSQLKINIILFPIQQYRATLNKFDIIDTAHLNYMGRSRRQRPPAQMIR